MRVLDANPDSCGWSIETYCTGYGWDQGNKEPCGAKLEVADKDLRYRTHTDISGVTDGYYVFVCPICHCCTELPEKKIPDRVRMMARRKKYTSWAPDID